MYCTWYRKIIATHTDLYHQITDLYHQIITAGILSTKNDELWWCCNYRGSEVETVVKYQILRFATYSMDWQVMIVIMSWLCVQCALNTPHLSTYSRVHVHVGYSTYKMYYLLSRRTVQYVNHINNSNAGTVLKVLPTLFHASNLRFS